MMDILFKDSRQRSQCRSYLLKLNGLILKKSQTSHLVRQGGYIINNIMAHKINRLDVHSICQSGFEVDKIMTGGRSTKIKYYLSYQREVRLEMSANIFWLIKVIKLFIKELRKKI